jgi:hypothetical protein
MKKNILLVLALFVSTFMLAQEKGPSASWLETTHDFGTFKEEDGVQSCTFEFVNIGNEPIVLTSVKPSCGCTATDYTQEPVQPGGKGYVKATYNPAKHANRFNKSITVVTNELKAPTVLRITGNVIPKEIQTDNNN